MQHLFATGSPQVGNASFGLVGDHSPPSSILLGLVADAQDVAGSDPLGLGALFHVDLFGSSLLLGFDVVTDVHGSASATIPIPNDSTLAGATVYFQTLSVWLSPCGLGVLNLSSSVGLKAQILS